MHVDAEGGKWSLCLYPNGDNLSREGQLGVFVKVWEGFAMMWMDGVAD